MHDLIIIGAGPAGLTAAIYAARKKLDTLVISKNVGGQATLSWEVENYLGYNLISGVELVQKFREHVEKFGVEFKEGVEISDLKQVNSGFEVSASKEKYRAKAVIIASGKNPRKLNVPGEKEFAGKGIAYCATCDAPLFQGKDVAVVGGGNSAIDATLQLTKIANKIYLININPELGGDEITREKVKNSDKVEILNSTNTVEINGEKFVNGILVQNRENDEEKELPVQGIFVEIGSVPSVEFLHGLLELNETNEIKVNCKNETNVPGIFAAGDCTDVPEKQIIIAAGEGSKAVLAAYSYLIRLKE